MDPMKRSRHIGGTGPSAADWARDAALGAVPTMTLDALVPRGARLVVVAPHPDDEILTCGALLQLVMGRSMGRASGDELKDDPGQDHACGAAPLIVAVTDGEASHPGSPGWPQERLRRARACETEAALACLGIDATRVLRLGLPDGGVTAAAPQLARRLEAIVQPGDIVVTTWCFDGHPDHEATARACAAVARHQGTRLLQAPVWGWHWSAPGEGAMPFARAHKLAVPAAVLERKRAALACFHSQIEADASSGAAPILPGFAIERALHPFELYFPDPFPDHFSDHA